VLGGVLLGAVLLGGCGKGEQPAGEKPTTKVRPGAPLPGVAETMTPAKPSPLMLVISVNDRNAAVVAKDWPVVVQVEVFLKEEAGAKWVLGNGAAAWADAVRLEVVGPGGADGAPLFAAASASKKTIELTRELSGLKVWTCAAGTLAEGKWRVRAVVDERKLGGTLPAGMRSTEAVLTVVAVPAALTPRGAQQKCLAQMQALVWKDEAKKALEVGAGHLAMFPEDVPVLFLKGQLLRGQGKKADALAAFRAALKAANRKAGKMGENFALDQAIEELKKEIAVP
jgi:hypothetical protein